MNGYTNTEFALYCLAEAALVQTFFVTCSMLSVSLLHQLSHWEQTWQARMLWVISVNRRCLKSENNHVPFWVYLVKGQSMGTCRQPSPPLLPALSLWVLPNVDCLFIQMFILHPWAPGQFNSSLVSFTSILESLLTWASLQAEEKLNFFGHGMSISLWEQVPSFHHLQLFPSPFLSFYMQKKSVVLSRLLPVHSQTTAKYFGGVNTASPDLWAGKYFTWLKIWQVTGY